MAIKLVEGVPRSGKSFYAVYHMAKNFFEGFNISWLQRIAFWILGQQPQLTPKKDLIIITNIAGFKPKHIKLSECYYGLPDDYTYGERIEHKGVINIEPAVFFSYEYQEQFVKRPEFADKHIIYVIDEAQVTLRFDGQTKSKLNSVWRFFEYHGHWGIDVYLVTQNIAKIPTEIRTLVEYSLYAQRRSRTIGNSFVYIHKSEGKDIGVTETLPRRQDVFALYKSQDKKEAEAVSNPLVGKIFKLLIFFFLVCGFAYWHYKGRYDAELKKSEHVRRPATSVAEKKRTPVDLVEELKEEQEQRKKAYAESLQKPKSTYFMRCEVQSNAVIKKNYTLTYYFLGNKMYRRPEEFPFPLYRYNRRIYFQIESFLFESMYENDPEKEPANCSESSVDLADFAMRLWSSGRKSVTAATRLAADPGGSAPM